MSGRWVAKGTFEGRGITAVVGTRLAKFCLHFLLSVTVDGEHPSALVGPFHWPTVKLRRLDCIVGRRGGSPRQNFGIRVPTLVTNAVVVLEI